MEKIVVEFLQTLPAEWGVTVAPLLFVGAWVVYRHRRRSLMRSMQTMVRMVANYANVTILEVIPKARSLSSTLAEIIAIQQLTLIRDLLLLMYSRGVISREKLLVCGNTCERAIDDTLDAVANRKIDDPSYRAVVLNSSALVRRALDEVL